MQQTQSIQLLYRLRGAPTVEARNGKGYHRQYLGMIEIGQTDRTTSLIGASNSKVK